MPLQGKMSEIGIAFFGGALFVQRYVHVTWIYLLSTTPFTIANDVQETFVECKDLRCAISHVVPALSYLLEL